MMSIKTLVLDDEATFRELFAQILHEDGHEVVCVENLTDAREQLRSQPFHLAMIDIELRENEIGLDLLDDISRLNRETHTFCAPIVFTNFVTQERVLKALRREVADFREKPVRPEDLIVSKMGKETKGFVEQELLIVTRNALRKVLIERIRRYKRRKYTVGFHLAPGQKTRVELTGPTSFVSESSKTLDIDINDFSNRTDDLQFHFNQHDIDQRLKWRSRAKNISESLYKSIFAEDAELKTCLYAAREKSDRDPLHIVFRGTQEILRLPIELLPGEVGQLITQHPLSRQISGILNVRSQGIESSFEEGKDVIKVLLIGSNTIPPLPGVDEEIDQLGKKLQLLFRSRGMNSQIQIIPTKDASYDRVYGQLNQCQYHIVHYAGHGFHDENDPDESGIYFWEKPNQSGDVKPMPIRTLRNLLSKSDVRFFFLSCCVGAQTAGTEETKLRGNDFQGILEGLVRVGIPAVLGYRWNVWDTDAQQFAVAFYESLLTDFSLDVATFNARRALQEKNHYSETWASPVLVMQTH